MKKVILSVILLGLVFASGCSSIAYRDSEREIRLEKSYYSLSATNEAAIRAVRLSGGAVGVGVDVTKMEVLMKHPFRQLGAAVLDVGVLYGIYAGIEEISSSSSESKSVDISGDGNVIIINSGDNGTGTIDQHESSEETNN